MLIGALPVGTGYGANPTYPMGGNGPEWRTNYGTSPSVPEFPQNPLRQMSESMPPFAAFSSGSPAVPLDVHMLQGLRGLSGLGSNGGATGPANDPFFAWDREMEVVLDPHRPLTNQELLSLPYAQRVQAVCVRNPQYITGALGVLAGSLRLMGAAVGGYHGWKRNKSGWSAAGYGAAGFLFPLITTGVGLAQGLAQPKRR